MNQKRISQALDDLACDAVPPDLDMRSRILAAIHAEERAARRQRNLRLAAASALVALVVIAGSVPDVAQAVRQGLGFIPGFGLVDTSYPVRQLAAPVSQTRDGVTVTIEQATLSADRTVIDFSATGLPAAGDPGVGKAACAGGIALRLPDGKIVDMGGFNALDGAQLGSAYHGSISLGAVPADAGWATLIMPCIPGAEESAAPSNWEFGLNFKLSEPGLKILPVIDATAQVTTLSLTATISHLVSAQTVAPADGIHLQIDHIVPRSEGDLIYASLRWEDSLPYSTISLLDFHLTDVSGARIPLLQVSPDASWQPTPDLHEIPLAFQIQGKAEGSLTLSLTRLSASLPVSGAGFSFDPGSNPQPGQNWTLDQQIWAAGYPLRLFSAERTADGYEFTFQQDPEVGCVDLAIDAHPSSHGSCGNGNTSLAFDGKVPTGLLAVQISNLEVILTGNWQVVWTP
jgi:hypothetical protein